MPPGTFHSLLFTVTIISAAGTCGPFLAAWASCCALRRFWSTPRVPPTQSVSSHTTARTIHHGCHHSPNPKRHASHVLGWGGVGGVTFLSLTLRF
jgi:hypothetical protein